MLVVHRKRLAEPASRHCLPTMGFTREFPESGAVKSYGPDNLATQTLGLAIPQAFLVRADELMR